MKHIKKFFYRIYLRLRYLGLGIPEEKVLDAAKKYRMTTSDKFTPWKPE